MLAPILSLDQAEDLVGEVIGRFPSGAGKFEVQLQRAELSGFIEGLARNGSIVEEVRAILHAIYFEGFDRYAAIEMFGFRDLGGNILGLKSFTVS